MQELAWAPFKVQSYCLFSCIESVTNKRVLNCAHVDTNLMCSFCLRHKLYKRESLVTLSLLGMHPLRKSWEMLYHLVLGLTHTTISLDGKLHVVTPTAIHG